MPPPLDDDKVSICLPFLLDHLEAHRKRHFEAAGATTNTPAPASSHLRPPPLAVGLNGVQGSGKTTLAAALAAALSLDGVRAVVCSIDDFYLTHDDQVALAARHPHNALVQHRGEPGTHDMPLMNRVLAELLSGQPTAIPRYDKAAFAGQGDRRPTAHWLPANQPGHPPVDVAILEGWCVGFRALPDDEVERRRRRRQQAHSPPGSCRSLLLSHALEHLLLVNGCLRAYDDVVTDRLHALVHVDADDPSYAYAWRAEQEDRLRWEKGDPDAGMTAQQLVRFVDGYFPAYELYTDGLRAGVFPGRPGCQLRIVIDGDRKVKQVVRI